MNFFYITGFVAWLVGVVIAFFYDLGIVGIETFQIENFFGLAVLTIAVFAFSAMFFGKTSHLVVLFAGMISGTAIKTDLVIGILSVIPILLAAFGGKFLGLKLQDDFHSKSNVYLYVKEIAIYFIAALIIGVSLDIAKEFLPKFSAPKLPKPLSDLIGA